TVRKSSHASTCVIEFPQLQVTVRKVSDDAPDLVAESVVTERERETFTIRLVENNAFDIHYKKWSSQFTGGSLDQQDPCYSLFDEVMIIMDDEVTEETCGRVASYIVKKHRESASEHDAGWMRQYLIGMADRWGLGKEAHPLFQS
ncbi:hypothetical protein FOZ62_021815, partial [Perkinsus olseni]